MIVIQHYHEDEGWEELPTEVDFPRATATALVSRLSIFALTVKEPEVETEPTPTPEPLFIPVPTITPVPLPTEIPTPVPVPDTSVQVLPTVAPTATPIPLPTATPVPPRPDVEGVLLRINGKYVKARQVIMEVVNGEVWLDPMAEADGSYKRMTEVTLGAFPTDPTHKVLWEGWTR